ncbi:MAG: hypothetical protein JWM75_2974 [Sphingomonas bacterium]|nr:hypothetical protein [Sphingomonas bacterium]
MLPDREVFEFVRSSFRSVWTLELLLLLKASPEREWEPRELVDDLRGSDLVVSRSIDELLAAGLVVRAADGSARYQPAKPELDRLVEATAALYARMPDAVRRTIIAVGSGDLNAFANAFKLRGSRP